MKKAGGRCSRQCAQNGTLGVTEGWSVWLAEAVGAGSGGSMQVGLMQVGVQGLCSWEAQGGACRGPVGKAGTVTPFHRPKPRSF